MLKQMTYRTEMVTYVETNDLQNGDGDIVTLLFATQRSDDATLNE